MKSSFHFLGRAIVIGGFVMSVWLGVCGFAARAEDAATNTPATSANDEGDKAWREVRKATQPPMPPPEWQQKEPSKEEVAKFYTDILQKGADKAKDFYTQFPKHAKATDAHKLEYQMLMIASVRYGDPSRKARLDELEAKRMNDPSLSEDERFQLRIGAVQRLMGSLPGTMPELEKSARALQKDFPKRDEVYQVLMMVLSESEGDKARALAKEIMDNPAAPEQAKTQAQGILKRMEAVGKPVNIQFAAVDGRKVNVSDMKGKVVLVDFWATWCGPCMAELPHVKEAYAKLHDKGFEIVGISFDQDKGKLEDTLKEKEMTWPQYFDGRQWQNKFGVEFGINSIPTMWLVDKKGNLRDMNARGDLEGKVTKLLAEQ